MNDQERLAALVDKLQALEGLDQQRYQRLAAELERAAGRAGYDDQGRLKVAMFDAKSYDVQSFERQNDGRYAIHPIKASLNAATARAADGYKVVCIFVNDTCDAAVVSALASRGVELIALRCAGFNNVVVTSHQGYLTHEALANIADTTLANIEEFARGKRGLELTNAVGSQ